MEATERTSFSQTESFKRLLKRRNTKSFKHRLLDKNIRQVYFPCGFLFSKNHFGYSCCKPSLFGDIKQENSEKHRLFGLFKTGTGGIFRQVYGGQTSQEMKVC